MSLKQTLFDLKQTQAMHHAILVSTNDVDLAFNDVCCFALSTWGVNLKKYDPNSVLIKPNDAGNILIEQIRQMKSVMQQTTSQQGKIVVICDAQEMNLFAANACLKFLEEPFEQTNIFLITNNITKIIATIKSRCYLIKAFYLKEDAALISYHDLIIQGLIAKNLISILDQIDLKKNWHDFTKEILLITSNIVKFHTGSMDLLQEDKVFYQQIAPNIDHLLKVFNDIQKTISDVDSYDLEKKTAAIIILNSLQKLLYNQLS